MSRQRVTAAYVEALSHRLTDTDLAIVGTLDRMRLATTSQLQRLHVTDGTPLANSRQVRRRLKRLLNARAVKRLDRVIGGSRAGSSAHTYSLDTAGQRLASACGPAGGRRLRPPWTPGISYLAHRLEITELYVLVVEASRRNELELLAFDAEPLSWRRFSGPGGGYLSLKPDAFCGLAVGEFEQVHFIEVDRATESLPAVKRKLDLYSRYWKTGREQSRLGLFPQVLFVCPDSRRRASLEDLFGRRADSALFAAVERDDALDALTGRGTP